MGRGRKWRPRRSRFDDAMGQARLRLPWVQQHSPFLARYCSLPRSTILSRSRLLKGTAQPREKRVKTPDPRSPAPIPSVSVPPTDPRPSLPRAYLSLDVAKAASLILVVEDRVRASQEIAIFASEMRCEARPPESFEDGKARYIYVQTTLSPSSKQNKTPRQIGRAHV